jgi:AcrR family transcriptional regulator
MVRIKTENREQFISQTRQTLLNAAAEEFARQGYDQANINSISIKAGFAKGTIYNYFPSKQALLLALIDSIAREHLEYLRSVILTADNPASRLELFFRAGFEYVASHVHRARVMFNTVNGSNQEQKEYCRQAYQPMVQMVAEQILLPGVSQGIFRQTDLEPLVLLLMTIYMGTASQVNEQGRPWLDPNQVADFVLHALRPAN